MSNSSKVTLTIIVLCVFVVLYFAHSLFDALGVVIH